jgi:predicted nucleic acid-binding protein
LIFGAYKGQAPEKTLEKVEKFLQAFEIISFEYQVTYHMLKSGAKLRRKGMLLGPMIF